MHFLKSLSPFKPTKFSGCALWLAADRGITTVDGKVSAWADQSGNGRNASQSTVDYRPAYVASAQGSKPTVRFDGSNDYLTRANQLLFNEDFSVFVVASGNSVSSNQEKYMVAIQYHEYFYFGRSSWSPNNFSTYIGNVSAVPFAPDFSNSMPNSGFAASVWGLVRQRNISASVYKNGIRYTSSSANYISGTTSSSTLCIGGNFSYSATTCWSGDISEIIIFNRALTDTERYLVELYLSRKYAIALS